MSVLTGLSRAGPSNSLSQNVARFRVISQPSHLYGTRRYASGGRVADNQSGRKSFRVERDAQGAIIQKKKEKNLGAFRPMPAAQLTHPLFESENRDTLQLPTFHPASVANMVGKAVEFPLGESDPVRIFGLPKKMLLEFRILSKPCSVVRDVTVSAIQVLENAKANPGSDTRVVLTGRSGSGKSFLLLQAVEYSIANDWIVVYVPRAVNLVNSTTPYTYDLRTQTYLQPAFAYQTLQRLLTVNARTLSGLHTSRKLVFEKREVPIGTSLVDLIGIALKDQPSSPVILDALMTELSQQTKYPVLLAVDDFQALYSRTAYRDPHFSTIRPYHLSMPRLLLDFASGKRKFARGAVLGAVTYSDPNYPLSLELREALKLPHDHPPSPYDKRSRTIAEYAKGLQALRVPEQLSIEEASALYEVWMTDKALVPTAHDEVFLSKYAESSGNPREFVWKGLLSTLET